MRTADILKNTGAIIGVPLIASALAYGVEAVLPKGHVSLVYMSAVLFVAVTTNTRIALACALVSFLALNAFFTEPRMTLIMNHREDILTAAFFLILASVTGQLAARLRERVSELQERDEELRTQAELAEQLVSSTELHEILDNLVVAINKALQGPAMILQKSGNDWQPVTAGPAMVSPDADLTAGLDRTFDGMDNAPKTLNPHWIVARFSTVETGDKVLAVSTRHTRLSAERAKLFINLLLQLANLGIARIRAADELQRERLEKEKELLRSALLSSISHDLRTPLASLVGSSTTLLELHNALSREQQVELIESIHEESNRLDIYIQNLLDMTRLGSGGLKLERIWTSPEDIIAAVTKRIHQLLPATRLVLEVADELPELFIHPALIGQALFNVVENAAKFSPVGEAVTLTVRADENRVVFSVSDKGPGIPEDEKARVFDMFHTLSHGDQQKAGAGLGLTICQGMISAHGGTVSIADPPEGSGTTIELSLPIADQQEDVFSDDNDETHPDH